MSELTLAQANTLLSVAMAKAREAGYNPMGASSCGTGDEDEAICIAGVEAAALAHG